MNCKNYEILSNVQLKRIGEHKYSHSGQTLLDPLMQKYWTWFVSYFPVWLAPNVMTLTGLCVNIITSLILVYYSPDAKQHIPSWAFLLCAIGLFIYQTLDALDGKQARRTNSSSPLGELFDHGCDAISTIFVSLSVCVSTQLGYYPNWMLFQCIAANALFYTAHWQTYVSGTLKFSTFDVTEAQFSVIGVFLVSALFGPEFWGTKVPLLFLEAKFLLVIFATSCASLLFYNYMITILTGGIGKNGSSVAVPWLHVELKLLLLFLCVMNEIAITLRCSKSILSEGAGKNGSTVAGTSVLSPFIPIALVVMFSVIIYQKSPSNLYENHPCLYLITFGIVVAKITKKLVVAHMTRSEMTYFDSVLIGPLLLFMNQYFNTFIDEYMVLWVALIYSLFDMTNYSMIVCTQIARYLKIRVFTIKPNTTSQSSKLLDKSVNSSNDMTDCDSAILLMTDEDDEEKLFDKNNFIETI